MVDAELVWRLLSYDEKTGVFAWRKRGVGIRGDLVAGRISSRGYAQICIRYKKYASHRLAWLYMTGEWPTSDIDHINGNRSDNRFANLRLASELENARNRKCPVNSSSGLKGIYKSSAHRWRAQIKVAGERIVLGHFDTKEDAHAAYAIAATRYFGNFANDGRS